MNPEIVPSTILTHLSERRSTGCLEVVCENITWIAFLQSGQLLSVDCSMQSLAQLSNRLRQGGCDLAAKTITSSGAKNSNLAEGFLLRQEIDRLTVKGLLEAAQASQVCTEITTEALESLLWISAGKWQWHSEKVVATATTRNSALRLDLSKLIDYYQKRLKIWQKFITIVQSPHQRPYLVSQQYLTKPVAAGVLSPTALSQIAQMMQGISLRELALLLKQDELKLVQLLIPYIRESVICLREPAEAFNKLPLIPEPDLSEISISGELKNAGDVSSQNSGLKIFKIACIDDSPFILDEIEKILGNNSQYSLTKIEDPVKAAAMIFRLKPDLILMDITMPDINGYKLCRLFRSSEAFETTPIIMVTGNKGLIDKARAKLVGATDYLTKPFSAHELLELVEKYLVTTAKATV